MQAKADLQKKQSFGWQAVAVLDADEK